MQSIPSGIPPRSAWRQCLWLCLPALLIGAALRISVLMAIPEGYYGADSNSYFETASQLWNEGHLEVKSKRRWIYPLLLIPAPLLPGSTAQVIAVCQHAIGLATIIGIGWIVLHLTHRPKLWVPLVTTLAAIWPRMLWYEQEIIAESVLLACIVLAAALAFPIGSLRRPQRLFWYLIAVTLIVAVKPHGKPIWMGLLLAAVLIAGPPWKWGWKNLAAAAASVVVMMSGGSSSQGAWLLLSSTLPLVKTDGEKYAEYRAILRPHIEEARADLWQYPWEQGRYKKHLSSSKGDTTLGPDWMALFKDDKKFTKVAKSLAIEAILTSPFTYARLVLLKIGMVMSDENPGERLAPDKFWSQQDSRNDSRWDRRPAEMKLMYETDRAGYNVLTAERKQRTAWYEPYLLPFTRTFIWTRTVGGEDEPKSLRPAWFGLLALLGLIACLRPALFRATSPLWLSLMLYMGIIFAIGDTVSRYLQAVEWIGMIFVAVGLDWALGLVWRDKTQTPETAAGTPAPEIA
jgi:hypothetical protein